MITDNATMAEFVGLILEGELDTPVPRAGAGFRDKQRLGILSGAQPLAIGNDMKPADHEEAEERTRRLAFVRKTYGDEIARLAVQHLTPDEIDNDQRAYMESRAECERLREEMAASPGALSYPLPEGWTDGHGLALAPDDYDAGPCCTQAVTVEVKGSRVEIEVEAGDDVVCCGLPVAVILSEFHRAGLLPPTGDTT
jgi:hypothetical protein